MSKACVSQVQVAVDTNQQAVPALLDRGLLCRQTIERWDDTPRLHIRKNGDAHPQNAQKIPLKSAHSGAILLEEAHGKELQRSGV